MSTWYYKEYKAWLDSGCPKDCSVTELDLSENNLTYIPAEICQLQNLTELWLSYNQLASIPPEIGQLQNLTQLWLNNNQLASIPAEIGQLQNLTELWLDANLVENMPLNITRLLQRQRAVAPGVYADTLVERKNIGKGYYPFDYFGFYLNPFYKREPD